MKIGDIIRRYIKEKGMTLGDKKSGKTDKEYKKYEEMLFSHYKSLSFAFDSLFVMEKRGGNIQKARYYAEKKKDLVRLFEMGDYNVFAADLELVISEKDADKTITCVQGMLNNVDTLYAFENSPLYSHMTFKKPKQNLMDTIRKSIVDGFKTDDAFSYMKDDPRWYEIMKER